MATLKQRKAVEGMVENGGNASRAMLEANYSPETAHTPSKLTKSKGFRELMAEYGLTEGLITKALVSDIKKKPKKRFNELSLGAEILGMKKSADIKVQINIAQILDELDGSTSRRQKVENKSSLQNKE